MNNAHNHRGLRIAIGEQKCNLATNLLRRYAQGCYGNKRVVAITTLGVTPQEIGRQVALLFANGNPQSPVIMGIVHSPLQDLLATYEVDAADDSKVLPETTQRVQDVVVDGQRIVIEGREEIVLKCGDASITLTKSGKILIRGKYLVNRSSGVNRIMGGSVQIN